MSKNKKSLIVVLIGLLLIGIGFFIHLTNRYRLVFILLGFIIQIIGMVMYRKKKLILVPILVIIFASSLIIIDYLLVANFDRLPVLAIRNTISSNTKIYNGAFYRVWKCNISDKKMYIDKYYKSNFYCDSKELKTTDINDFLLHFEKKFKKYKNDFVKIEGKISEIQGLKSLDMKSYKFEVDKLNGYVTFDDNVKLRFLFNGDYEKLSTYSLYDNVKVIGRVVKMEQDEDDTYTITLVDSKIVSSNLYEDFEFLVNNDKKCYTGNRVYYENKDQKYYFNCLNEIELKYSEEDIYELNYLLQDNKIKMEDIYKKANNVDNHDEEGYSIYHYNDFSILKCNTKEGNKDIIFGNTSLAKTDEFCYSNIVPEDAKEIEE